MSPQEGVSVDALVEYTDLIASTANPNEGCVQLAEKQGQHFNQSLRPETSETNH
jgi:hypothetical protein